MTLLTTECSTFQPLTVVYARKHWLFLQQDKSVTMAYVTPSTLPGAILECQRFSGLNVKMTTISNDEFTRKVNHYYESVTSGAREVAEEISDGGHLDIGGVVERTQDLLAQSNEAAPVVRLINAILVDAIKQRASDIHIETYKDYFSVRYRIDGLLLDVAQPSKALVSALVSRVKVMANMDIAEKRTPQDGSISVELAHRAVDVRISILPTQYGERVVMRLLNKQTEEINIKSIGLSNSQRELFCSQLEKPQGLVLITGPTGSGKSTTLYAGLDQVDTVSKNILTVEDPIEYELRGIGQTQINVKAGMTFPKCLRAMLRQDPDVVMVGEIRDSETVKTAIQASLTGHLVLSTLHTNTAIGAINRLIDMGAQPYLLSSTLEALIGQRLIRVLCHRCKEARAPTQQELDIIGPTIGHCTKLYFAPGCDNCQNKGYQGRTGIYEIVAIDQTLRTLIHNTSAEQEIIEYTSSISQSLVQDGLKKAISGVTTIEEVFRVATI